MFWGEIDIGLDIITVFRVLFIFNNFIFINNADVENCGSFKSFGYIYIYINEKKKKEKKEKKRITQKNPANHRDPYQQQTQLTTHPYENPKKKNPTTST